MNRAAMVLLDYSKAVDTVWRSHFLLSMANKSVPFEYVRWINGFLLNPQESVQLHGFTSSGS